MGILTYSSDIDKPDKKLLLVLYNKDSEPEWWNWFIDVCGLLEVDTRSCVDMQTNDCFHALIQTEIPLNLRCMSDMWVSELFCRNAQQYDWLDTKKMQ